MLEQVEQARRDLELVARLDAIRLRRSTALEGKLDTAIMDRDYTEAFRDAGLVEVGADANSAGEKIRNSAVSGALVAALEDWASCTRGSRRDWVLEVTRNADPDPVRDRLRESAKWDDGAALAQLAKAQVMESPPQLLAVVGNRLMELGADAEPLLRAAQERHPSDFWINFALGNALANGKPGEAVGYYRAALALRPGISIVHYNLGNTLYYLRRLDESVAAYKKAIELDPKRALLHYNLGNALREMRCWSEAVTAYKKSIAIDPKDARPHYNLGRILGDLRRWDEAVVEYANAFAAEPKLAADLKQQPRYNAACAASLAAAGNGKDSAKLDDKERTRLRKQALDWLRADLAAWTKLADGGAPASRAAVVKTLQHWQKDAVLAGLRDAPALAQLPESERAACQKLWKEVAELLKKCGG